MRSAAAGALGGILAGQGVRWLARHGFVPHPVLTPSVVAPIVILVWACRRGSPKAAAAAWVVAGCLSTAAWAVVEARL